MNPAAAKLPACYSPAAAIVEAVANKEAPPRLRLIDVSELLSDRTPPPYLVRGYLPRVGAVWLYSPPGEGKSWIALDLALRVASGLSWGNRPTAQGPIVYLAGEGLGGIRLRVAGWIQAHPGADPAFHLSNAGGQIDTEEGLGEVFAAIDALPEAPALVVIDTQSRWQEGDESSTKDGAKYVRAVDAIRDRYGCLVLNVHHTGKADGAQERGSGTYRGAADCMFRVSKTKQDGHTVLTVHCMKSKDWEAPAPLAWTLQGLTLDGWNDEEGEPVTTAYLVETEPPRATTAGRKATDVPPEIVQQIVREYPNHSQNELARIITERLPERMDGLQVSMTKARNILIMLSSLEPPCLIRVESGKRITYKLPPDAEKEGAA